MSANVEIPPLLELVADHRHRQTYATEYDARYAYPHVKDPALARRTAERMRHWLGFHTEGNGDRFCVDTSLDPAPVVFDQHDWYDGGTGENGRRLADSLLQFFKDWAQVCFQSPRSLWWPSVFKKDGAGIDWSSAEFREPFRLPGGDS